MRFVTFSQSTGHIRPGIIEGDAVRALGGGVMSLEAFIALDKAARGHELPAVGDPIPLSEVTLHAPLHPKKNVFCVGRNYLAHAAEGARARGVELKLPDVPTYFTKAPTAIANPGQTLELNGDLSQQYDWEAELAVVIGTTCRDVSPDDALSMVFGYMCLNDVTARDVQMAHVQWFKGKSLDNTCPIGPWIVSADEIPDPQALHIALTVNGETRQSASTADMIFNVRTIISVLSRGMTLEPGDIIATGTPEGVGFGMQPPLYLKDGDVMDIEIEKIGHLRNPVSIKSKTPAAV